MTSSSPSPSGALHQHANADGDQDEWPESSEPVKVEPAKLLQQKDHAQANENERSHRYARCYRVLVLQRLSFYWRSYWLPFDRHCTGHTRGCWWLVAASEEVQVV